MWKLLFLTAISVNVIAVTPTAATSKCGVNEEYSTCPQAICRQQECKNKGQPVACPDIADCDCKSGCICKKKFLKNSNGTCIPEDKCPSSCPGPNEYFDSCNSEICPPETCEGKGKEHNCPIKPAVCSGPGMCRCNKGYLRDQSGKCIPEKQCPAPSKCGVNEEYSTCPQAICRQQECKNKGQPVACPDIADCDCKPGCVCKEKFLKSSNGTCIPEDKCPSTSCGGDPNATPGCGVNCGNKCSDYNKGPVACPLICNVNGCDCKKGYVFDENLKKCVLPKDCTPVCGLNEKYSDCINGGCFGAKKCSEIGAPVKCVKIDPKSCIKGCDCIEGYLRSSNGTCIPQKDCPPVGCPGPNEYFDNCNSEICPPETCEGKGKKHNCPIKAAVCSGPGMCRCNKGYLRDQSGKCIPEKQCPAPPKCGVNEEYSTCPQAICRQQECKNKGQPAACPDISECNCTPGCVCKDKFLKNSNGTCVPEDKCPSTTCKGLNEVYDPCDAPCPPRRCDVDNRLIKCKAPPKLGDPECVVGCRCADGYARTDNGTCVLREQCPKCTQPNEVYDSCPDNCDPQTCESIGQKYNCPAKINGKPNCQGACRCKPNFYRNKKGDCISKENCLKCRGPHEYFACGSACDNECATIKTQGQDNCPIINIKCNEMCYCEKDYARAANGTCIPIKDCPNTSCPGPNEYFDSCNSEICPPETCESKGKQYNCPIKPAVCSGPGMCRCNKGYLRDQSGKCIPEKKCPAPPKCGLNEEYSTCPQAICRQQECKNKGQLAACPDISECNCTPGCVCKDKFLKNSNGTCISEDKCPSRCPGPNEYFDSCNSEICPPETCEGKGKEHNCPIKAAVCSGPGMCRCNKGYLRDKSGKCIPENQCPAPSKCGVNEEYSTCPQAICRQQECKKKGHSVACPDISECNCTPGCVCKKKFLKNSKGSCIPEDKCPMSLSN